MAKSPKYKLDDTSISIDERIYSLKDLKEITLEKENTHNRAMIILLIIVIIFLSGAHFLWLLIVYLIWRFTLAQKRSIVYLYFTTDERLKKEDTQSLIFYDLEASERFIKEIDEKIESLGLPLPKFDNSESNL